MQLAGGQMQKRSVDDTGCKGMFIECNLLGGLASWGFDMTWVLGLSELEHLGCMDIETFLLDGLVCMQSV
eukprot:1157987-Pelagomonas_calceolata.AAC.1